MDPLNQSDDRGIIMSLVTTPKGDQLLEFHGGNAHNLNIPEADQSIPLPLALVAARYEDRILFVFNSWRGEWELPGGIIEAGETPQQAAIRELAEESGQHVEAVTYFGWMKFQLQPDNRLELGALCTCALTSVQPFIANDEASKIMFWDLQSPIEEPVSAIDLYLAHLT
jgi:8-oxo-dGTP diphosphatase